MSRDLKPTNDTVTPSEQLPDRSNLSRLYERKRPRPLQEDLLPSERSQVQSTEQLVSVKIILLITFLLAIPAACSYIGIASLYQLEQTSAGMGEAFENRLSMIGYTVLTFIPWLLSLRVLNKVNNTLQISTTALIVGYAFLAFPTAYIASRLGDSLTAMLGLLIVYILVSYIVIRLIVSILTTSNMLRRRAIRLASLLGCVTVVAIIFQITS